MTGSLTFALQAPPSALLVVCLGCYELSEVEELEQMEKVILGLPFSWQGG